MEKVAEKLTSGSEKALVVWLEQQRSVVQQGQQGGAAAGSAAAGFAGAGLAAKATAAVASAGVGLAIGVVFHGVKSYFRMRKNEEDSPYRFLTLMEQAGVVFRSDLGTGPGRLQGTSIRN